ncbi:nitroreductase/quinone reductase family protein [Rhodococcus sp. NPDC056960]|uniref:nitroreductase/quinone reductase family protein n=1 Tax=Rhodococcus sp. NPDC056960 TaxID=3345982 RepID=UPI00362A1611
MSSWVWNIRNNPNVHLRLRRRTFAGIAREINDPTELQQAREAICETVSFMDYGECRLHLRGRPSRAKIKDLHSHWFDTGIPLVIDLAGTETAVRTRRSDAPSRLEKVGCEVHAVSAAFGSVMTPCSAQ